MNEVIYRAASHLNVRINEILRGESIERLTTEERAKVNDIQQVTEGLAGLQVDLGAMRAEIARLSDWKESAMDVFSKWDAVGEALIDKPKLGASTAGQALQGAIKLHKRIAELEKALMPFADPRIPIANTLACKVARAALAAAERKGEAL